MISYVFVYAKFRKPEILLLGHAHLKFLLLKNVIHFTRKKFGYTKKNIIFVFDVDFFSTTYCTK